MMLATKVLLIICFGLGMSEADKCPKKNIIYTGKKGIQWSAYINKESTPQILSPSKEKVFHNKQTAQIVVKLDSGAPKMGLLQVEIDTKNAEEVQVIGLSDPDRINGKPTKWITSSFKFNGEEVNELTIQVKILDDEGAIRHIVVKGCALVEWCDWGKWGKCSASCGGGKQTRVRECDCGNTISKGFKCQGPNKMTKACNTDSCLVTEINKELEEIAGLWDDQDGEAIANDFYDEDAVMIQTQRPIVRGREDIAKELTSLLPTHIRPKVGEGVQMSKNRIYTIGKTPLFLPNNTYYDTRNHLTIWKWIDDKWFIEAISLTQPEGGPPPIDVNEEWCAQHC